MIRAVRWPRTRRNEAPFERNGRNLRVTVYCPRTSELSPEDSFKLELIREFSRLDTLEIADTAGHAVWRLELDNTGAEHCVMRVTGPEGECTETALWSVDSTVEVTRRCGNATDSDVAHLALRYPLLDAHAQTERDIFVTSDPFILGFRDHLPEANIHHVAEALRVIALHLRNRGDYTIIARGGMRGAVDRLIFYRVATSQRLPELRRWFSACGARASRCHDGSDYLASAIRQRALRVLQARDEIGCRFYERQGNSSRDEMIYHFDYLTLLLTGAIDAQAHVAARAYSLDDVKRSQISFRHRAFCRRLEMAGARELFALLSSDRFNAFLSFLASLRNSVHGTGLSTIGYHRPNEPQASMFRVHEDADRLWAAATTLASPEMLGISRVLGVTVEPYSCAVALAEMGFQFINDIARATEVERMLPQGAPADVVSVEHPHVINNPDERLRIDALAH